jgi:mannose-6-phosphate isomerase-like protein (cupin superfamily)
LVDLLIEDAKVTAGDAVVDFGAGTGIFTRLLVERRFRVTAIEPNTAIEATGQPPKSIEEFIGRVNSDTAADSIARMKSPPGWAEPGQTPEFDEYTVVLRGCLHVKLKDTEFDVAAGQAIIVKAGEWVQYSSPSPEGAEYIAVCIPAFSPNIVHRDGGV